MESAILAKSSELSDATVIIVDSGATKANWLNIDDGIQITTEGINPHTHPQTTIRAILADAAKAFNKHTIKVLHFYGSGCDESGSDIILPLLKEYFAETEIHVHSDLLGACRAVCGTGSGMVGILGTGSNSCLYNGTTVTKQCCSGGYLLGDEGSAFDIGKRLLLSLLRGTLPQTVADEMSYEYNIHSTSALKAVYSSQTPNRYISSFAKVATRHRNIPMIEDMLYSAMSDFITRQIVPLSEHAETKRLNLVGAVADACREELASVCNSHGIILGNIVTKPIDALANYHRCQHTMTKHS